MARSLGKGNHTGEIWRMPFCSVTFFSHIRCLPDASGLLFMKGCRFTETLTWLFHTISIKSLNVEISKTVLKLLGSFPARFWIDHVFDSWYPAYLDKSGKPLCERRRRHGVVAETFHQYHCCANSATGTAVVFQCSLNLELWICHCNSNVGNTGTWHWICAFLRQPINSFFWLQLVVCLDARTNPCSSSRRKGGMASLVESYRKFMTGRPWYSWHADLSMTQVSMSHFNLGPT